MSSPRKGWSNSALETVRQYRDGSVGPGQVLDVLARERIPMCLDYDYEIAAGHARRLCDAAVALVESRDAAVFGDVAETMPAQENDVLLNAAIARLDGCDEGVSVTAGRSGGMAPDEAVPETARSSTLSSDGTKVK